MSTTKFKQLDCFVIDEDDHIKAIRTSQSPNWYLQFNQDGVQRRKSLKTANKKEALKRALIFRNELLTNPSSAHRRGISIESAVAAYLKRLEGKGRHLKTLVIVTRYLGVLQNWAEARKISKVEQLDLNALEAFEAQLRDVGNPSLEPRKTGPRAVRPLSRKSVREFMKSARSLIRFCKDRDLIDRDPAVGYELPSAPQSKIESLTDAELKHLCSDPALGKVWSFFVGTGLRLDEVCWLQKADIEFDESGRPCRLQIRAKCCAVCGKENWAPKHKAERAVPLAGSAVEIATTQLASDASSPWLFPNELLPRRCCGRWRGDELRRFLKRRLSTIGREVSGPHILRHTYATRLANSTTISISSVQKLLGHSDIRETQIYLHPSDRDVETALRQSIGEIDDAIDGKEQEVTPTQSNE